MQTTFLPTSKQWREAWRANWANPNLLRCKVAVAYCSRKGAEEIKRAHGMGQVPLQLLVGLNDGVTDILAQEALFDWAQESKSVEVHGFFQTSGRFHPKVYIFECAAELRVLIGSVNLTHSAFCDNTEATLEWIVPVDSPEAKQILSTFSAWWQSAPPLEPLGSGAKDVAKLGIEERLLGTMRRGVLVDIEVQLAPARGQLEKDVFRLGQPLRVQAGSLRVERSRQVQVLLIGDSTYRKLMQCRDEDHENCHSLSFACAAGYFVPVTAFVQWKEQHADIEQRFRKLLAPFCTPYGCAKEKARLRQELPTVIAKVWKSIHGKKPLPAIRQNSIIKTVLEQFEQRAPAFPGSVRLNLSLAPHPFPAMCNYSRVPAHTDEKGTWSGENIIQQELHTFALQNREETLRNWMTTLLTTTRQRMLPALVQLGDNRKRADTHAKVREELCRDLKLLNFYDDAFCEHMATTLISTNRPPRLPTGWEATTRDDLLAVDRWSTLTLEEVFEDFARRAGWL